MFRVTRTRPAPASLASRKSYSEEDVLVELRKIFYEKCYLCESRSLVHLNVEHLKPHKNKNKALKFDWNNLFYVCSRCNNFKRAKYTNILDCTDHSIDVLRSIKHLPPVSPFAKLNITAETTCPQTIQTAELINNIFNSDDTPNKTVAGDELRYNVFVAINYLNTLFLAYINPKTSIRKKLEFLEELQTLAGKEQEFSAFIRWTIFGDERLSAILLPYVD